MTVVCPFIVNTPLLTDSAFSRMNPDVAGLRRRRSILYAVAVRPERLARCVLRDVARNRAIVVYPRWAGSSGSSIASAQGRPIVFPPHFSVDCADWPAQRSASAFTLSRCDSCHQHVMLAVAHLASRVSARVMMYHSRSHSEHQ